MGTFRCNICEGMGHLEQECATKNHYEVIAKKHDLYERHLWYELKRKLMYGRWLAPPKKITEAKEVK